MAPLDNTPIINAPAPSSSRNNRWSTHNRSPSPLKPTPRDIDPLLRDLSPTSTLRIFSPSDADPTHAHGLDPECLSAASQAEKSLGLKASQACLQLRSWARELESWHWSGRFDAVAAPDLDARDQRLHEITRDLDTIDVEELKDYALAAHDHRQPSSLKHELHRPGDQSAVGHPLIRLEDITTLITATVLQALPYLSRLLRQLETWSIRIAICKDAPTYLGDLENTRVHIQQCCATAFTQHSAADATHTFNKDALADMKVHLTKQLASLGKRLDRFLDDLEGREDTVPDSWIDEFESLEASYSAFLVRAERQILNSEWQRNSLSNKSSAKLGEIPASLTKNGRRDATDAIPAASTTQVSSTESDTLSKDLSDNHAVIEDPPRPRSRHVPIIIPIHGDGQSYPHNGLPAEEGMPDLSSAVTKSPDPSPPPLESDAEMSNVARIRSAFINAEIEKSESLQKQSKTPVRSFEHASTAFARLFKREKAVAEARSSSSPSGRSIRSVSSHNRSETPERRSTDSPAYQTPAVGEDNSIIRESPKSNRRLPAQSSLNRSYPQPSSPLNPYQQDYFDKPQVRRPSRSGISSRGSTPQKSPPETYSPTGASFAYQSIVQPERAIGSDSSQFPEDWPLSADSIVPATDVKATRSPTLPAHGIRERQFDDEAQRMTSSSPVAVQDDFTLDPNDGSGLDMQIQRGLRSFLPSRDASISPSGAAQRPRSALAFPVSADTNVSDGSEGDPLEAATFRPQMLRRASYASIESHPRSAVRSFNLSRRTSLSARTPPLTPTGSRSTSAVRASVGSFDELLSFPSPPSITTVPSSSLGREASVDVYEPPESDAGEMVGAVDAFESPVLGRSAGDLPQLDGHAVRLRQPSTKQPASSKRRIRLEPEQDTFDRHVSEVLSTLHGNIKFKSRMGAEPKNPSIRARTPDLRGLVGGKPRNGRSSAQSERAVTIAPAESSPKKTSVAAEPVKLYHLRQEGREEPIKLFVRLVGEGERVMVRVGGGWADLAEYLRQYAEHHGSRTVSSSGNDLEMLTSDSVAMANTGTGVRRVSGPIESAKGKAPMTPDGGWLNEAQPRFTMGDSDEDTDGLLTRTTTTTSTTTRSSELPSSPQFSTPTMTQSTFKFIPTNRGSRPSTADQHTPSSRSGLTETTNTLAGPASAKRAAELPDHKARWVEGMIEKAKASAEKDKTEREKYFTEMGRVGGTKRILFNRSGSGTGPGI